MLGVDLTTNDLKFIEDDWKSPTLGALGVGWEVWLNGIEITQFTYFQKMGGISLDTITCEITYGLERIAMYLQSKKTMYELEWSENISYKSLFLNYEKEISVESKYLKDDILNIRIKYLEKRNRRVYR